MRPTQGGRAKKGILPRGGIALDFRKIAPRLVVLLILAALAAGAALPAAAHVVGTLPLETSEFHNRWSEDPGWEEALAAYYAGEYDRSVRLLLGLLEAGRDEEEVRRNLAVVYKDMGAYREAAGEYERVVALAPDDAHAWLDWGFALLGAGEAAEAKLRFEASLALDDKEPWAHLGRGLALLALGERGEALASITRSVLADERFAVGYEALGRLHLERGDYRAAALTLDRAIRLDPSYLWVYFSLARAYDALGEIEQAWNYYERASRILGGEAVRAADAFAARHETQVLAIERAKDAVKDRRHTRVEPVPQGESAPMIRVGMLERGESLVFSAGSAFTASAAGGEVRLSPGVWTAALSEGAVHLRSAGGEERRFQGDRVRLTLAEPATTWILFDLISGAGYFWARQEDRELRGDLILLARPEGLTIVNELDIESYLLGVVPAEVYPSMHPEAVKAQAIAARTYALRSLGRYESRGFDVLGSVASAEYRGVGREHPLTTRAVLETRGLVLTHRGRLIEALYHSSAGGYTSSGEDVWGGATAYLQAVPEWDADEPGPRFPLDPRALESWLKHMPDVFSSRSEFGINSTFRWVQPVPAEEIKSRVERSARIGSVVRIVPLIRDFAGRVHRVRIEGTEGVFEVAGDRIRSTLGGLKSNAFKVEALAGPDGLPETFLIHGAGFGHGVGLSQFGAAGMAEAGYSAEEILTRYYPGASVTGGYNR